VPQSIIGGDRYAGGIANFSYENNKLSIEHYATIKMLFEYGLGFLGGQEKFADINFENLPDCSSICIGGIISSSWFNGQLTHNKVKFDMQLTEEDFKEDPLCQAYYNIFNKYIKSGKEELNIEEFKAFITEIINFYRGLRK